MADESIAEQIDTHQLLESIGVDTVYPEDNDDPERSPGRIIGGAIGAALGRSIGARLGERLIDRAILDRDGAASGADRSEAAPDDSTEVDEPSDPGSDGASSEPGEADEEGDMPDTVADLEDRSYRELQTLAKDLDVKANLAREEMTDRIAETLDLER